MDHLYDLKIRSMEIKDLTQVLAIEKDAFPNLFPSTNFRTEISRNISQCIVAEISEDRLLDHSDFQYRDGYTGQNDDDRFIVAYSVTWEIAGENHIISIGVRRRYLRLGIGMKMMRSIISESVKNTNQSITLEVRPSNDAAKILYEKLNFQVVGRRNKYYSDNLEDALIMTLDLQNQNTN